MKIVYNSESGTLQTTMDMRKIYVGQETITHYQIINFIPGNVVK